jgi:hypothetical protein
MLLAHLGLFLNKDGHIYFSQSNLIFLRFKNKGQQEQIKSEQQNKVTETTNVNKTKRAVQLSKYVTIICVLDIRHNLKLCMMTMKGTASQIPCICGTWPKIEMMNTF